MPQQRGGRHFLGCARDTLYRLCQRGWRGTGHCPAPLLLCAQPLDADSLPLTSQARLPLPGPSSSRSSRPPRPAARRGVWQSCCCAAASIPCGGGPWCGRAGGTASAGGTGSAGLSSRKTEPGWEERKGTQSSPPAARLAATRLTDCRRRLATPRTPAGLGAAPGGTERTVAAEGRGEARPGRCQPSEKPRSVPPPLPGAAGARFVPLSHRRLWISEAPSFALPRLRAGAV